MTRTARATRAVVVPIMVVLTLTATGCPWDKADDAGKAAPAIEEYVGRILRGDKPSAVIADADKFGADFKAAVAAQAAAARRAYNTFTDPETREPACLTLDAVNAAGGVDKTSEQKVEEFAEQQFTVKGKAKAFASDLKKMSNLELSVIPSLWCTAYDVRDPE